MAINVAKMAIIVAKMAIIVEKMAIILAKMAIVVAKMGLNNRRSKCKIFIRLFALSGLESNYDLHGLQSN